MFLKNRKLSGGVWREEKEKCNYNLNNSHYHHHHSKNKEYFRSITGCGDTVILNVETY